MNSDAERSVDWASVSGGTGDVTSSDPNFTFVYYEINLPFV